MLGNVSCCNAHDTTHRTFLQQDNKLWVGGSVRKCILCDVILWYWSDQLCLNGDTMSDNEMDCRHSQMRHTSRSYYTRHHTTSIYSIMNRDKIISNFFIRRASIRCFPFFVKKLIIQYFPLSWVWLIMSSIEWRWYHLIAGRRVHNCGQESRYMSIFRLIFKKRSLWHEKDKAWDEPLST